MKVELPDREWKWFGQIPGGPLLRGDATNLPGGALNGSRGMLAIYGARVAVVAAPLRGELAWTSTVDRCAATGALRRRVLGPGVVASTPVRGWFMPRGGVVVLTDGSVEDAQLAERWFFEHVESPGLLAWARRKVKRWLSR